MKSKEFEQYLYSLDKQQLVRLLLKYLPEETDLVSEVELREINLPKEELVEEALDSVRQLSGYDLNFDFENKDYSFYHSEDDIAADLIEPLHDQAFVLFRRYLPALLQKDAAGALQFYLEAFTELDEYNSTDAADYDYLSILEGDLVSLIQEEYEKLEPKERKAFYELVAGELDKASEPVLVEYLRDLFEAL